MSKNGAKIPYQEDPCYTLPESPKAESFVCPDQTYTSCFTNQVKYQVGSEIFYYMERGCSKEMFFYRSKLHSVYKVLTTMRHGDPIDGNTASRDHLMSISGTVSLGSMWRSFFLWSLQYLI